MHLLDQVAPPAARQGLLRGLWEGLGALRLAYLLPHPAPGSTCPPGLLVASKCWVITQVRGDTMMPLATHRPLLHPCPGAGWGFLGTLEECHPGQPLGKYRGLGRWDGAG